MICALIDLPTWISGLLMFFIGWRFGIWEAKARWGHAPKPVQPWVDTGRAGFQPTEQAAEPVLPDGSTPVSGVVPPPCCCRCHR